MSKDEDKRLLGVWRLLIRYTVVNLCVVSVLLI